MEAEKSNSSYGRRAVRVKRIRKLCFFRAHKVLREAARNAYPRNELHTGRNKAVKKNNGVQPAERYNPPQVVECYVDDKPFGYGRVYDARSWRQQSERRPEGPKESSRALSREKRAAAL